MNYENMSDFEINVMVANIFYPDLQKVCLPEISKTMVVLATCASGGARAEITEESKDYCNNPSDAWGIILENNISLDLSKPHTELEGDDEFINGKYLAYNEDNLYHSCYDENPLRAAMICFLKRREAEDV